MTTDEYLDAAPEPQGSTLRALRAMLADLIPDGEEGMSYGVPAVRVNGTPIAGYAQFKGHCGFYPHSGTVLAEVEPELIDGYEWATGTLRFPIDEVPDVALIRRILELRRAELDA